MATGRAGPAGAQKRRKPVLCTGLRLWDARGAPVGGSGAAP